MTPDAELAAETIRGESNAQKSSPERADVPRLPGIASQVIGERMRAMYSELVREPVPDELVALIQKLKEKERAR